MRRSSNKKVVEKIGDDAVLEIDSNATVAVKKIYVRGRQIARPTNPKSGTRKRIDKIKNRKRRSEAKERRGERMRIERKKLSGTCRSAYLSVEKGYTIAKSEKLILVGVRNRRVRGTLVQIACLCL